MRVVCRACFIIAMLIVFVCVSLSFFVKDVEMYQWLRSMSFYSAISSTVFLVCYAILKDRPEDYD